jgi:hypothetical protein
MPPVTMTFRTPGALLIASKGDCAALTITALMYTSAGATGTDSPGDADLPDLTLQSQFQELGQKQRLRLDRSSLCPRSTRVPASPLVLVVPRACLSALRNRPPFNSPSEMQNAEMR